MITVFGEEWQKPARRKLLRLLQIGTKVRKKLEIVTDYGRYARHDLSGGLKGFTFLAINFCAQ
jgi:hypothetical protein